LTDQYLDIDRINKQLIPVYTSRSGNISDIGFSDIGFRDIPN